MDKDLQDFQIRLWLINEFGDSGADKFSKLTEEERDWLMNMTANLGVGTQEMAAVLKKYGMEGLKALLSSEAGLDVRQTVLTIVEQAKPEVAKKVLEKYVEISEAAQATARELMKGFYGQEKEYGFDRKKIIANVMERAKKELDRFANELNDSSAVRKINKRLGRVDLDALLFASIFRELFKDNHPSPEELKDIEKMKVETNEAQELSEKTKTSMLNIADENWQEIPSMHDFVVKLLQESLGHPRSGSVFKVMRKDDEVLAFMRIDQEKEGEVHIGSVNVNPQYRGSAMGEVMLAQAFEQLAATNSIKLEAYPGSPITVAYSEKLGFVIDGVHQIPVGGKKPLYGFNMKRDDKANDKYTGRSETLTQERLVELMDQPKQAAKLGLTIKKFDLRDAYDKMIEAVARATEKGEVVSRFFADPTDSESRILVFEAQA